MNNEMIKINNQEVKVKEFNSKRVLIFKEIDLLHERPEGTAKRNFSRNKKHFIKNVDYFQFKGEEGREALKQANFTNFVQLNTSPNFNFYFITETGYSMLCKSFTDDLSWTVQRQLVSGYFRYKEILPKNEFDVMRMVIDKVEEVKYGITQATNLATQAQNKALEAHIAIKKLEDSLDIKISKDDVLASDIAHQLQLYSESGLAHSNLVGAIARVLKLKVDYKKYYEDDYIKIIGVQQGEYKNWQTYFTPKGQDLIINWFEKNQNDKHYEVLYKRGQRKGTIKEKGYIVNGVHYKVK